MKTFAAITAFCSLASAYAPFSLPYVTTHQPSGNPDGQVNYYRISFNVSSSNGGSVSKTSCHTLWGDNTWLQPEAYSMAVPTGSWIACDSSDFHFKLFPYFSIGNFSVAVQQNFTDSNTSREIIANGTIHITNQTSQYTCEINPQEVSSFGVHAQGDCSTPSNGSAFSVPVTSAVTVPGCTSKNATAQFKVTGDLKAGQQVLVVGSIPGLGSWAPSKAVKLTSRAGSGSSPTFTGSVKVPAGHTFKYKYILRDTNGSETWECCENRVATVSSSAACSTAAVGNSPDYFRGGGSSVRS